MTFRNLNIEKEYRNRQINIIDNFYVPILREATSYDRAVGFFSSTSLSEIAEGILPLVKNGGKIRIIASPKLSEEDIEAINVGYRNRNEIIKESLERELLPAKNKRDAYRLNLLANLIASGVLEFKIALVNNHNNIGMYHEKMGIFYDKNNDFIAFSGSANESKTAISLNYESIDVYCSWKNEDAFERGTNKITAFNRIWENKDDAIEAIHFPSVNQKIFENYKINKQLEDYTEDDINTNVEIRISNTFNNKHNYPELPQWLKIRKYQNEAVDNWEKNSFSGIFDMATGTGKTLTGLVGVERLSKFLDNHLAVIIVCPYQHLVEQWVEDIKEFNIKPIIGYGCTKQKDWKKRLDRAIQNQNYQVPKRGFFCLITTNATFSREFIQSRIQQIESDILLLVDEAHNFGASNLSTKLDNKYKYRLALSATLDRKGDLEGTNLLHSYFGRKCIEYDLERAIKEKKLTEYDYKPIVISLNEDELQKYDGLTNEISRCLILDRKTGKKKLNERGKILALQRARLVAGANNKTLKLKEIMQTYSDDDHMIVYCGATQVENLSEDFTETSDEDIRQIDLITKIMGSDLNMKVAQYTSNESIVERKNIQASFERGNIQALIAIKCLDEGVNIPSIKTAFILASTTNPKEYIQRRGRVLRLFEGKEKAVIYDFITLPRPLNNSVYLTETEKNRELSLVKNELIRAEEFARLAINQIEAYSIINEIKEAYNLFELKIDNYDY